MAIAAALLTGGASRRMGVDKATVAVGGVALVERTAALLLAVADPVVELGPGHSGLPSVPDAGGGPLAALAGAGGIWASLPAGGHVLVVATDLPRLTAGMVTWLARHPSASAVVPVEAGRAQPLCARYPVAALVALAAHPPADPRLTAWVDGLGAEMVPASVWEPAAGDPRALCDADTPAELAALR